jgi:hypothetical protein
MSDIEYWARGAGRKTKEDGSCVLFALAVETFYKSFGKTGQADDFI